MPDSIIAWYQAELTRRGWSVTRTADRLLAQKATRSVVLSASALKTGKTAISMAELS